MPIQSQPGKPVGELDKNIDSSTIKHTSFVDSSTGPNNLQYGSISSLNSTKEPLFDHVDSVPTERDDKPTCDEVDESGDSGDSGDSDESDDSDGEVCVICSEGDADEDNNILFCDGCDIAVHQNCFGIASIPEGAW